MKFSATWIVAAAFVQFAAGAAEVSSTSLKATLDDKARGAVTRLVTAHGADLSPAQASTPLFRIKLTRTDDLTNSVWITSDEAATFTCDAATTNSYRLVYGGYSNGVTYVTCTVQGGGDAVRWNISAQTASGWAIEETEYPRLLLASTLGSDGGDDRFVCGTASGGVTHNPGAKPVGWQSGARHPGGLAAQFAAVYDDRAGLYFAAEDAAGHAKRIGVERIADGLLLTSSHIGFDAGLVEQPYALASGGFEGTIADPCSWHDAADLYRAWAGKQAWCATWFRNRADVPAWMRDAPAIAKFGRDWLEKPEDIRSWVLNCWKRAFVPSPLLTAYAGWEKRGENVMPDCFPVRPDNEKFVSLVSDLRAEGVHAFVQPCGHHWTRTYDKQKDGSFAWDDSERFERIGHAHAAIARNGSRRVSSHAWLRGGTCACLCSGDAWTREWWNTCICAPLAQLGCEAMQLNLKTGVSQCWSTSHRHAPGVGKWQSDAILDQLRTMRETMSTNGVEEAVVGVVGPSEFRNSAVGIQDYHSCSSRADEWASVFSYLYHEYVPLFQEQPGRASRIRLAHAAADGQMPVITPSMADLKGEPDAFADFMRRWVAYYHGEGREWLAFGRQVKPPRIVCAMQPYYPNGKKKGARPVLRPTVFCNAYVSSEGKKAIVLVNATPDPQPVVLYKGGARVSLELAGDEIRLLK